MKPILYLGLCLSLCVSFAPRAAADDDAVFTFSGKKGKPVRVIDHRNGDKVTLETGVRIVNQSTPTARRAATSRVETNARTREGLLEGRESTADTPPEDVAPATETRDLTPEEGLPLLRANNWITYTSDDKSYPKEVYNPQTKQFVPTQEVLQGLQEMMESLGSALTETFAPPPPRRSDPTP